MATLAWPLTRGFKTCLESLGMPANNGAGERGRDGGRVGGKARKEDTKLHIIMPLDKIPAHVLLPQYDRSHDLAPWGAKGALSIRFAIPHQPIIDSKTFGVAPKLGKQGLAIYPGL